MQIERRQNPYPFTWEIPVGILAAVGLLFVLGVHLGRGIANWAAGAGWHWPSPAALLAATPGILAGDASAGLAARIHAGATPSQLLGWVITVELMIAAGCDCCGRGRATPLGPRKAQGHGHRRRGRSRARTVPAAPGPATSSAPTSTQRVAPR